MSLIDDLNQSAGKSAVLKAQFNEFADSCIKKWKGIAESHPKTDRIQAKNAIYKIHLKNNLPKPDIRWVGSPLAGIEVIREACKKRRPRSRLKALYQSDKASLTKVLNAPENKAFLSYAKKIERELSSSFLVGGRRWGGDGRRVAKKWAMIFGAETNNHSFVHGIGFLDRLTVICKLASYDFYINCGGQGMDVIRYYLDLAQQVDLLWIFDEFIIACENAEVLSFNDANAFHAEDGPALRYPDGWEMYYHNGSIIPDHWGKTPSKDWNPKWLLDNDNAELRRVIIERCGFERIMKALKSKRIHKDGDMELRQIEDIDEEAVMLLKVVCPSTGAFYALRVPPTMKKCEQARQWTFGDKPVELLKET